MLKMVNCRLISSLIGPDLCVVCVGLPVTTERSELWQIRSLSIARQSELSRKNSGRMLGQIGASAGRISSAGVAVPLPGPGGSGPQELTSAVDAFNKAMSMVILEYSDAASSLGSATKSASANFDSTEKYNQERAAKLGVEWNK